jgi:hypothetical protein
VLSPRWRRRSGSGAAAGQLLFWYWLPPALYMAVESGGEQRRGEGRGPKGADRDEASQQQPGHVPPNGRRQRSQPRSKQDKQLSKARGQRQQAAAAAAQPPPPPPPPPPQQQQEQGEGGAGCRRQH